MADVGIDALTLMAAIVVCVFQHILWIIMEELVQTLMSVRLLHMAVVLTVAILLVVTIVTAIMDMSWLEIANHALI
jgi:hypothetical protein